MKTKRLFPVLLLVSVSVCFAACKPNSEPNTRVQAQTGAITLNGASISAGNGVMVDGAVAAVTSAGTYEISGTLDDGQIIVDTTGNVTLILNNADIACATSAPIYVKKARNVTITLADNAANTLTDGPAYVLASGATEPDAAVYSSADLIINGSGSLTVNAHYNDGIASRDSLTIQSGSVTVTAANHGIKGKDYLTINGGAVTVEAGGDGIKATNDTGAKLGYVEINGGTLDITADDEGVSAITDVHITGGHTKIATANNGVKTNGTINISGGEVDIQTDDDGLLCAERIIGGAARVTVNGEAVS